MPTAILEQPHLESRRATARATRGARHQWEWLAAGLALAFALPYLLTDLTTIDRDVYYGIYAFSVFGFFTLWLRGAVETPRALLTRNWRWGTLLGLLFACVTAAVAFTEKATVHPHGWRFAGAIVWRGVVYGAADGVLLSVFPILAVFTAFSARPLRDRSKPVLVGIGALALTVSLLFTAVYHLGYPDFQGEKVRKPLIGDVIWSAPTLATLSPVGAPIAHIGLHVGAVVHAYNTDTFLPPHDTAGAVPGLRVAAAQARALPPFSSVELAGGNVVVVHVGGKQSVVVHADANLLGRITTQVRAGNLVIGNTGKSITTRSPMSVDVNVPSLEALTLTGSGVITATGIDTPSLIVRLPGSGVLRATGTATRLDVVLGGSGDAQLEWLAARDAHAVVSGSGRIVLNATHSLDASVPGSGAVVYSGDPVHVTTSVTGAGTVTAG